jgi:hypothetical protein
MEVNSLTAKETAAIWNILPRRPTKFVGKRT